MTNSLPALRSLRRTPSALLDNPVLFVPVVLVLVLQLLQLALQSIDPILSSIVSIGLSLVFVVVVPFFQGGLIGMADEALDGRTTLQTFVDEGKSNYVSILVAYLAVMAVNFVLGSIAFFGAIFGGAVFFQSGGPQALNTGSIAVIAVLVAVVLLLYLGLVFFAQFYGQAIVLEDMGVVDGIKRSISVVRQHLVSTLGYSLLGVIIGGLAGIVLAAGALVLSPQSTTLFAISDPSLPIVVGVSLVVVAGGLLFGGFFTVYSVSFCCSVTR